MRAPPLNGTIVSRTEPNRSSVVKGIVTRSAGQTRSGALALGASCFAGLLVLLPACHHRDRSPSETSEEQKLPQVASKGLLGALGPGQKLEVRVRSQGCFRSIDRSLSFTRSVDGGVSASISDTIGDRHGNPAGYDRDLSEREVAAVDRELAYSGERHNRRCTTRKELDIILRKPAHPMSEYHIVDESCGGPLVLQSLGRD